MEIENAQWLTYSHLTSPEVKKTPYYLVETSSVGGIKYAHSFQSLMEESEEEKKEKEAYEKLKEEKLKSQSKQKEEEDEDF